MAFMRTRCKQFMPLSSVDTDHSVQRHTYVPVSCVHGGGLHVSTDLCCPVVSAHLTLGSSWSCCLAGADAGRESRVGLGPAVHSELSCRGWDKVRPG